MKTVQIFMSTYNGEKYIREQMDSILAQDCEEKGIAKILLFIRDDGSTDRTPEILEEYAEKYPEKIDWYQGENVGVTTSFCHLVAKAANADYYAFCDQDDVWMSDKLSVAITALEELEKQSADKEPILYCCRPMLVDENLNEIRSFINRREVRPSFGNAVVENIVVGCTMVMNYKLCEFAMDYWPKDMMMHDRWFYLLATCFGKVIYDETPHILYRQHGRNQVGMERNPFKEFKRRFLSVREKCGAIRKQAEEFSMIYTSAAHDRKHPYNEDHESIAECLDLLNDFLSSHYFLRKRIKVMLDGKIYRQRTMDNVFFYILFLLGFF